MRRLTFALMIAGLALLAACTQPRGDYVVYPATAPELASASVDPVTGVWESVPWSGADWLPFPPRVTMQVEHGLMGAPRVVLVYIAFDASGANAGLAAGDLALVVEVDASTITLANGTSGGFFVRIVAF
ncbi:MAG: hypothetical protein IT378_22950 [Sandaracinaceae bacterium]|nr:hypothetical protein [Sandaracinaceae bacterium]